MFSRYLDNARNILNDHKILIVVAIASFAMPFLVAVISHNVGQSAYSEAISCYYYGVSRDIFVMTLAMGGLLLVSYPGRETGLDLPTLGRCEYWLSNLAGIMAFLIALFPMDRDLALASLDMPKKFIPAETFIEVLVPNHGNIHVLSAMVFFVFAAVLCFLFSRQTVSLSHKPIFGNCWHQFILGLTEGWSTTNPGFPYKLCGLMIVAGLLWAGVNMLHARQIFWPEVLMLVGFSFCWLTKLFAPVKLSLSAP